MLYYLRLGENQFRGEIPRDIGNLRNLLVLDLYNNSLVGDVPSSIREMRELKELYLDNQHLLPLRMKYCGQRLPDLGRYSYIIVRDDYDDMMSSYCPADKIYSTEFTFSRLQDSGMYEQ